MRTSDCNVCHGKRLKKEALAVTVGGKNIAEICDMPVDDSEMISAVTHFDFFAVVSEHKHIVYAFHLADGLVIIDCEGKEELFSSNYACPDCGISIEEIEPRLFSFNTPWGACPAF